MTRLFLTLMGIAQIAMSAWLVHRDYGVTWLWVFVAALWGYNIGSEQVRLRWERASSLSDEQLAEVMEKWRAQTNDER